MNQVADVGVCSLSSDWWWKRWRCDRTQQYWSVFLASTIRWHILILAEPDCWRFVFVLYDNILASLSRNTHTYLILVLLAWSSEIQFSPSITSSSSLSLSSSCVYLNCAYYKHGHRCITVLIKTYKPRSTTYTHTTVLWPSSIMSRTTWESWHHKSKTRKVKPIWIYWSNR